MACVVVAIDCPLQNRCHFQDRRVSPLPSVRNISIAISQKHLISMIAIPLFNSRSPTGEEIRKALNSSDKQNVIFTSGVFEVSNSKLPKEMELVTGVSNIYEHNQAYHVINIKEILPSGNKTLEDAKGSVVNDYQNKIEEDWLLKLRDKFKVDVDKKVLKRLKSKINN